MKSYKRPSQRRSFWRTKGALFLILFILLVGGGAGWFFLGGGQALLFKPEVASAPAFYTATVQRGNIQISASGAATLVADQTYDLSFPTSGTVSEVDVKLGEMVKAGQVLARIGEAQSIEANIASLQLQLLQAQQALNTLQTSASVSLAQSYQDWLTAQQTYNNALAAEQRTSLPRCSKTVRTQEAATLAAAKQKLDDMTRWNNGSKEWIAANQAYQTAMANYNYCESYSQNEKTAAQAALDVATVNMQQAEAKYNLLKASSGVDPNALALDTAKVTQLQAQIAVAQQSLDTVTLTSPVNGKVIYLAASQGSMVGTSKFITVADISQATIQVSLDEADLTKLDPGATAQVVFDALPEETFTGKVVQVQPQLVTQSNVTVAQGLVQLDPSATKVLNNLPLGINGNVTVIEKQANNVLLVPIQALKDLGGQQYAVFVVDSAGQLQLRPVQVGLMDSTHAEIISGLQDGDVVSTGIIQTNAKNITGN